VESVSLTDQSPVDSGWSGINSPRIGFDSDGDKVVFKQNNLGGSKWLSPEDVREFTVNEIVSSHIMADEFGLPAVTYRQAEAKLGDRTLQGLACDFVDGIRQPGGFMSGDADALTGIENPQQAVDQTVVACWLGDWDRVKNNSNMFITPEGQLRAADFGYSMTKGLTVFGIPKANELVMKNLATPENVKPIVDKISRLSNHDVEAMVERVGSASIEDWSSGDKDRIAGILKANRDELKENPPFHKYFGGFHPFVRGSLSKVTYPLLLTTAYRQKPLLLLDGNLYLTTIKKMASALIGGPASVAIQAADTSDAS
jgi:hypothetical protein